MKPINNQYGFADIILIVVVAVLALGLGGYVYYQQRQANKTYDSAGSGATVTKHAKPAPKVVDPYAGWKSYTSNFEKVSFKYPANWTLKDESKDCCNGTPRGDSVKLSSNNGFSMDWTAPLAGIGGGCDPSTEPHIYIERVVSPITASASKQLYILLMSYKGLKSLGLFDKINGKTPVVGDTGDCLLYTVYQSSQKDSFGANYQISFGTNGQVGGGSDAQLTDDQYLAQPDVQDAVKVLASLKY